MRNLSLLFFTILICVPLSAQVDFYTNDSLSTEIDSVVATISIFDELALPDTVTDATIIVHQDSSISKITEKQITTDFQEVKGFRIQLFSSNKGASARRRAFQIKQNLISKYPSMEKDVYVTYSSPFWKVRVGNCQSQEKAQALRTWLTKEFPQYSSETYIVPSIILIQ